MVLLYHSTCVNSLNINYSVDLFSFQEFILPIYFIVILAVIKLMSQKDAMPQFGNFSSYSLFESDIFTKQIANSKRLLISPDNSDTRALMVNVAEIILSKTNVTLTEEYFANASEVENQYRINSSNVLAGILFNYNNGSNLTYALRYADGLVPATAIGSVYTSQSSCRRMQNGKQVNDDGLQSDYRCTVNQYLFTLFAQLQTAIDTALIRIETGVSSFSVPDVSIQMLPKPAFLQDSSYIQIISSMYFVIAYSPLISMLTVALVAEKEKKIKEGMQMMGLRSSVFWYDSVL